MRLGFISDLHLGRPPHSRCTSTPAELLAVLDMLERTCDTVVVVGDTYDLLRPRRPRGWRRELEAVRREHPELVARLERHPRVVGNHDRPLIACGVPEEWTLVSATQRVLVMHGHQWDVWLKKVWGLEESANFVAGWLERARLDGVSHWMGDVPGRLAARTSGEREGSGDEEHGYWQGVRQELERGFDVLVAGHTHGLELREMGGGRLAINTGSHVHGFRDAAVLDLAQGWALTWRDDEVRQTAIWEQAGEGTARGWRVQQDREEVVEMWRATGA